MVSTLISIVLCLGLASSQDSVKLQKTFKVGDKERFFTKLSLSVAFGDVDVHLKTEQRVLKLFENGDAELETELLEIKTLVNGQPMDVAREADTRKATMRVNAMGMPSETDSKGFGFSFLQFVGLLGDKPLDMGKKTPVAWTDPANEKRKASGTITLESVADGLAKLISSWEIHTPANPKPLKIDMTSFIETNSGRLKKASGTILGAQSSGVEVKAIQFSMESIEN
jgi:hypothetical protein